MRRSKVTREQVSKLLADNQTEELKALYTKLCIRTTGLAKNKFNIENVIIKSKVDALPEIENEVQQLREKKNKQDSSEMRLKTLAYELQKKMEQYLHDSKVSQLEEHRAREKLSAQFGEKVKDITASLSDIEERKTAKFNENQQLRNELAKCLDSANETVQPLATRVQGAEHAEELQVNHEFEKMIYEDYRSQVCEVDSKEILLQSELATFSDRFQELTDAIRNSNANLVEQKAKAQDIDATAIQIEKQYHRSREIVNELKQVVKSQRALNDTVKVKTEASRSKLEKYTKMKDALNATILELESSLALYNVAIASTSSNSSSNSSSSEECA